uniref:Uncharacterized protein n=1 Tax=Oryza brachyantha TaxID=4533 RepID=J3KYK6_ORYBR
MNFITVCPKRKSNQQSPWYQPPYTKHRYQNHSLSLSLSILHGSLQNKFRRLVWVRHGKWIYRVSLSAPPST